QEPELADYLRRREAYGQGGSVGTSPGGYDGYLIGSSKEQMFISHQILRLRGLGAPCKILSLEQSVLDGCICAYNIALIAASCAGVKHSDEAKAKISDAKKGKSHSEEHKANISAAGKGKSHSEETKAKMSASHKGQKHSAETKAKLSAAKTGRELPEGHKAKISNQGKPVYLYIVKPRALELNATFRNRERASESLGINRTTLYRYIKNRTLFKFNGVSHVLPYWFKPRVLVPDATSSLVLSLEQSILDGCVCAYNISPTAGSPAGVSRSDETKAKTSASLQGHKHSDETKAKMSASRKGRPSPMKGRKLSEETKAKMSASSYNKGKAVYLYLVNTRGFELAGSFPNITRCSETLGALLKYGLNSFVLIIFFVPDATSSLVLALEQSILDGCVCAYNILPTAGSSAGARHSDETKAKMSAVKRDISTRKKLRQN
ncbi:13766_t:CDS:2, partial [Acaulospora colombiana]